MVPCQKKGGNGGQKFEALSVVWPSPHLIGILAAALPIQLPVQGPSATWETLGKSVVLLPYGSLGPVSG